VVRTHKISPSNNSSYQDAATPSQSSTNPSPATNDAASLDSAEQEADQLSNRAAAINSSLDHLQQQQSAAGYGLRGDIASRQASMKNNLAKAQSAVQSGDLQRARKYMDLAQSDVDALEHFLGH
jgi:predicted  nucleic acid-binding Zn-ribbon protein